MGDYGYLHLGRVIAYDAARNAYSLESVGLARTARWPPVPSCVPGLQPGDRVILAAKGSSRDDLVIVGKLGASFPQVGDIDGLLDTLTTLDSRLDAAEGDVLTLDARLDTAEGDLLTLDSRLGTAEADVISLDTRLDAAEAVESDLATRLYPIELNSFQRDLYGDVFSTLPREAATTAIPLVNGTIYVVRMFSRRAAAITALRAVTAVAGAGAGASCAIALYEGSAATALNQQRTGTIGLTTLGRVNHTLSSGYTTGNLTHLAVALLPLAYTTAPQLGGSAGVVHSTLINPSGTLHTAVSKAGQTVLPASINLNDGTWTATATSKPWIAAG
jgi:hypothetical protein